jgi:glycosyltransferase involved in cell wall biosynthesis
VGIFSIVAETYNHALTEAWAAGLPALATDTGAQGERIRAHGGGFLISPVDPAAALEAIYAAADDSGAYEREASFANLRGIPSVAQMAERYAGLYREVLDRRRVFKAPSVSHPLGGDLWRMGVLSGDSPAQNASILARYRHPELQWKLRAVPVQEGAWQRLGDLNVLLVHSPSLSLERAEALIGELRKHRLPLVVELEGLDAAALTGTEAQGAEALRLLLENASLAITNSVASAQLLSELCARVQILTDRLDERLYVQQLTDPPSPNRISPERRSARLLCAVGLPPEEADFLRQVRSIASKMGHSLELDVVGDPIDAPDTWCRTWTAPEDHRAYARLIQGLAEDCDLGVAPILNPERGRYLGDRAYLEYAVLGLPGIYSAAGAYESVKHETTGMLVANDPSAWWQAIEQMLDPERQAAVRHGAWTDATGTRLLHQGAGERLSAIGSACAELPVVQHEQSVEAVADPTTVA